MVRNGIQGMRVTYLGDIQEIPAMFDMINLIRSLVYYRLQLQLNYRTNVYHFVRYFTTDSTLYTLTFDNNKFLVSSTMPEARRAKRICGREKCLRKRRK